MSESTFKHQSGFTILELMIALTVSLLLLVGMIGAVVNSSARYGELAQTSRQIENGRYAVEILREEIRHGGYLGTWVRFGATPAPPADACEVDLAALQASLPPVGVQAYTTAPSCVTGSVDGTPVLAVRRLDTGATQDSGIWMHTNARNAVVSADATMTTAFTDGTLPADSRAYLLRFYYLRTCSRCDGEGDGIPTLWRTERADGTWRSEPLVEGIENVRIEFGIDRNNDGQPNESAPDEGDAYVVAPTTDEWIQVVAARIYVLARNVEQTPSYRDKKEYQLGSADAVGPFDDNFRRHVYSTTARAMNTFREAGI